MAELEAATKDNNELTVLIAVNYGARAEIVAAAKRLAEKAAEGRLDPGEIDEAAVMDELHTSAHPDPDLIIRTSGEQRLSNFLLWQAAYAELMFAPEMWPDFTPEVFERAVQGVREP